MIDEFVAILSDCVERELFPNSPVHEAAFHEIQKIMDEPVLYLKSQYITGGCPMIRQLLPFIIHFSILKKEV